MISRIVPLTAPDDDTVIRRLGRQLLCARDADKECPILESRHSDLRAGINKAPVVCPCRPEGAIAFDLAAWTKRGSNERGSANQ